MRDHLPLGPRPARPLLRRSLRRPWCAGCLGTLKRSASLHPSSTGVPLGCTVRTWSYGARPEAGPPGCRTTCCRACQGASTPPGLWPPGPRGVPRGACRVCGARRHPGGARVRGSLPCRHGPLSTLRGSRYREPRLTRGQCGWLDLHWQGRAPFNTAPAFPGAPERWVSAAGVCSAWLGTRELIFCS
jgi:hypothetical protein